MIWEVFFLREIYGLFRFRTKHDIFICKLLFLNLDVMKKSKNTNQIKNYTTISTSWTLSVQNILNTLFFLYWDLNLKLSHLDKGILNTFYINSVLSKYPTAQTLKTVYTPLSGEM